MQHREIVGLSLDYTKLIFSKGILFMLHIWLVIWTIFQFFGDLNAVIPERGSSEGGACGGTGPNQRRSWRCWPQRDWERCTVSSLEVSSWAAQCTTKVQVAKWLSKNRRGKRSPDFPTTFLLFWQVPRRMWISVVRYRVGEYLRYSIEKFERYRRYSPFLYLICI